MRAVLFASRLEGFEKAEPFTRFEGTFQEATEFTIDTGKTIRATRINARSAAIVLDTCKGLKLN